MRTVFFSKFLTAVLIMPLLLVSCGESGRQGAANSLDIWTMFTGADGTTFTEMVETYNSADPEFKVNHLPITAETLYTRLQLAVASGSGIPDMAVNHVERIALFQEQGRLLDLAPYFENSPVRKENYNPAAWSMGQISGGQYSIPLDVHSFVLYVNWDLYSQYGLTDMDDGVLTWDELEATAEKILASGDGIIPIGMTWLRPIFLAAYAQLGGTLSDDGENPSFNNRIAEFVLKHYADLINAGFTQRDGEDPWRLFLGGSMLYAPEGIWMYNDVLTTGLNARMFDFPVFDANVKGNWTSSHQFTIPARRNIDSDRVAASLEFINWMGENSLAWAGAGQVPAHRGGQGGNFASMPQAFLANYNEELKIFDYKYFGDAVEALDVVLYDMFFGRIGIEDGLRQAHQETIDRIEAGR